MPKKEDYNSLSADRLRQLAEEQRLKLAQMREDLVGKRLKDTSQIRQERRELARILTSMRKIQ